jgi:hypothetical protein
MLFSKDKNIYDGSIPSSLIPKLEKEMEHYREELLELLENIHSLKLTCAVPGGGLGSEIFSYDFAHHLHLLSELIYTSITSQLQLDLIS